MRTLLRLGLAVGVLSACGCTSFAFKGSGKKAAPQELTAASTMVAFDGGGFTMGAKNANPDEFPAHDVELSPFAMDRTEVQNAHYLLCVDSGGCPPLASRDAAEAQPTFPVVGVTFRGAKNYCRWVDKRLPTEAEWEFAARAPDFPAFPWGSAFSPTRTNARGETDGYAKLAPVGSFSDGATPAGLLDMAGNAAEWTADWYDATYYQSGDVQDPKGPSASTGQRSVRGGSFLDPSHNLRTTARRGVAPNQASNDVGFRCAKSAK